MSASQDRVGVTLYETDEAMVVGLGGEIDFGNADWAGHVLRRTTADVMPPRMVVLDLSDVGFLSAAGVRMLYGYAASCADRGVRSCVVIEPEGIIERVARLAELDRHVPLYAAVSAALDTRSLAR